MNVLSMAPKGGKEKDAVGKDLGRLWITIWRTLKVFLEINEVFTILLSEYMSVFKMSACLAETILISKSSKVNKR